MFGHFGAKHGYLTSHLALNIWMELLHKMTDFIALSHIKNYIWDLNLSSPSNSSSPRCDELILRGAISTVQALTNPSPSVQQPTLHEESPTLALLLQQTDGNASTNKQRTEAAPKGNSPWNKETPSPTLYSNEMRCENWTVQVGKEWFFFTFCWVWIEQSIWKNKQLFLLVGLPPFHDRLNCLRRIRHSLMGSRRIWKMWDRVW